MFDIEMRRPEISKLCKSVRVKRLDVFGSATRGELRPDSDVDILVQFDRTGGRLFDRYFELKEGLEHILGRTVDLVVENAIVNPYFKQGVERSRKNVYAA